MEVINRAAAIEMYTTIVSYKASRVEKLPSLNEFLALTSKDSPTTEKVFDEKTDKFLEEQALKRFEERRQNVE